MKRTFKRIVQSGVARVAPLMWRVSRQPRLLVLMYHRVLPADHPERRTEQPGMYVSPDTFAMHIETLRRHFHLMHLDDWLDAAAAGRAVPANACAITFDDGWRDNYEYAFPLLRQANAPATIYLVSEMVGAEYTFWPNRLAAHLVRAPASPERSALAEWIRELAGRPGAPVMPRPSDVEGTIAFCKVACTDAQITAVLDAIDEKAGASLSGPRNLATWEEVREMLDSGLVRAGSHTRRHARLTARLDAAVLHDEIVQSAAVLQSHIGHLPRTFCYPNGDYTPAAVEIVRANYLGAVTTMQGWNQPSSDRYLLRRVGVHEDVSDTPSSFLSRLAGVG